MLKTLSIAALVAATATASFAGSYAAPKQDDVVEDKGVFVPVTGSGIGAPVVIGGVVAAAAIAALLKDDDEDTSVDGHGSEVAD